MMRGLRYRWFVWSSMVLAYMVVFFHRLAAGVVRSQLTDTFDLSPSSFASISAAYFFAYMIMQIPVGLLADSLGARFTVSVGMVLAGAGSILFGLAPSPSWLFLGRFIVGVGVSTVFVSILKIQSQWFREREFGTMSGLTALVGNLGGVLAQTPLAILVGLFSWRASFMSIGTATGLIAVMCWTVIRNTPQDKGFPPINEALSSSSPLPPVPLRTSLKRVAFNWRIWPLFVFSGCFSGVYLTISGTWGTPYLQDVYAMTIEEAASVVSYTIYGTIMGSLIMGNLSDRIGLRKTPLVIMNVLATMVWSATVLLWKSAPPVSILRPLFFLLGFLTTSYVLSWGVIKEINDPRSTGVAIALANTGSFLGSAMITSLMGTAVERLAHLPAQVRFHGALSICLAATVLGLACSLLFPETQCRNIWCDPDE
ncbi:MAG: MFS transporter [Dethiosulfovibrio peptidovorans]|nr:MAG: MFS transporter [Dethiosulfovibrio peptidovorans]